MTFRVKFFFYFADNVLLFNFVSENETIISLLFFQTAFLT